jgi:6,7-dimethyl-8-ribityllumazine synthase
MASVNQNLSSTEIKEIDGSGFSIGIVVARWNDEITNALYEGCKKCLLDHGVNDNDIHKIEVPGAFELPVGARLLAGKETLDSVICIGCVIKGDTKHDEYISNAVATGVMNLGLSSGKPIIFGVLTPNTMEQALERSGGIHGNKGVESAMTALEMVKLSKSLKQSKKGIGF